MSPLAGRDSATRRRVVIDHGVHIFSKTRPRDAWRAGKRGHDSIGRHEHTLAQRGQLSDRYAVSRDEEGLPFVERAHDSAAVVAEFALGDASAHRRRL